MVKKLKVESDSSGQRLDVFASNLYPFLSRAFVTKLIKDGRIEIEGKETKPGYRIRDGEYIISYFDESELEQIKPIDLPIIYEDGNVLVIDKPAGVISHSRGKYWNEPSVASFVRQKTGQKGDRSGIVHRLDRATSGVMICSKNNDALKFLQKQFSERKVVKTYFAVVEGHLKEKKAVIDMPIERNPKRPSRFRVGANGKPSVTEYEVVKSSEKYDLLLLKPKTGRTHQLRVHFKYLKHPILGDSLYEGEETDRLYLHAESLSLRLPGENKPASFKSSLPKEFKEIIS